MSIDSLHRSGSIPENIDSGLLANQLEVLFRRSVGVCHSLQVLIDTPDAFLEDGSVNPKWVDYKIKSSLKTTTYKGREVYIPKQRPGQLMFDKENLTFVAVDKDTPIREIESVSEEAKEILRKKMSTTNVTKNEEKEFLSQARIKLKNIYNSYYSRDNGQREVLDSRDLRGLNLQNLASGLFSLGSRSKLNAIARQARNPLLFNRYEPLNKNGIRTPSEADRFLYEAFNNPSSQEHKLIQGLIELNIDKPSVSYIKLANIFYAGDMGKTFQNLSAVAKMTGRTLPEGWQKFTGHTSEFRKLERRFSDLSPEVDGYLAAADDIYAGDMGKTFKNLSL